MITILLGKPCSGKGLVSEFFVNEYDYKHISTGDILRANNMTASDGKLISDDIVNKLMLDNISNCKNVVLDGYPRTIEQFNFFNKNILLEQYIIIYLDVTDEVATERMLKRKGIENRLDDNIETFKVRLNEYNNKTLPMIEKLQTLPHLFKIDGNQHISKIKNDIRGIEYRK